MENFKSPNSDIRRFELSKDVDKSHEDDSSSDEVTVAQHSNSGFQHFDIRNITVERISGSIFTLVVGIAIAAGLLFLFYNVWHSWIFYVVLAFSVAIFSLLFFYVISWPKIEHRHRAWRLTGAGLELRHGVWWKHMQAVPLARVQHADVSQGPIQRMYGVGTLTVHTAGTSNSSVNLAGLSHEVAINLRDKIIRQRASGDVV